MIMNACNVMSIKYLSNEIKQQTKRLKNQKSSEDDGIQKKILK